MPDTGSLQAGAARVCITPPPEMINWVTGAPYDGVLDPLYIRAVCLGQGERRVAIVAFDLPIIQEAFVDAARAAIGRALKIAPQDILIHATHTHSAPRSPWAGAEPVPYERDRHRAVLADPVFARWAEGLAAKAAEAAAAALHAAKPAVPAIRRVYAGDFVYNRRPIQPDGGCVTQFSSENAFSLSGGRRFGETDPVLTCIDFLDAAGASLAKLVHFACHSVAIYPRHKGLSGDWPGRLCERLRAAEGGEPLFLQGCAGDLVPNARGIAFADEMAERLCERLTKAAGDRATLVADALGSASEVLEQPVRPESRPLWGDGPLRAEVQALRIGELRLVTLPGEPLIALSRLIVERSPFPQTLVCGYSNGRGTFYTPLAKDKARGGYEAEPTVGPGAPECADRLVEAAARLLDRLF